MQSTGAASGRWPPNVLPDMATDEDNPGHQDVEGNAPWADPEPQAGPPSPSAVPAPTPPAAVPLEDDPAPPDDAPCPHDSTAPAPGPEPADGTAPEEADARSAPPPRWNCAWAIVLCSVVVGTMAVRFAEPVKDADLWWQMAYGRDMIANRTLVPDHTAYSWSPTSNDTIYCAWLAETALYLIHQAGGMPLLFAFRYLCMLVPALCVLVLARRLNLLRHPLTWLLCMMTVLMSHYASFIKPQLFSVVFMSLTVFTWMRVRKDDRTAHLWCYALPAVMLAWVNAHGLFMLGLAFILLAWLGEEMNALFSPSVGLSLRVRRHLFVAVVLSGLATLATPYGIAYPVDVIKKMLVQITESAEGVRSVREFDSIFNPMQRGFLFIDYLVVAGTTLLVLVASAVRSTKVLDWCLLLTNVVFAAIYMAFVRTTFLWAPVFALGSLSLLSRGVGWLALRKRLAVPLGLAMAALTMGLGGRIAYRHATRPSMCQWLGFGTSYINPVEEAEFIADRYADSRVGNDYNSGGYLLWRLAPRTKIFLDPRCFPYLEWYKEYTSFETVQGIETFLKRFPADIWCVVFPLKQTVTWFRRSPEWTPVYYGCSAAVFARKDLAHGIALQHAPGIADIKNLIQGMLVLEFALNLKDFTAADEIVAGLEQRFSAERYRARVHKARQLTEGLRAYSRRDYNQAIRLLTPVAGDARLNLVLSLMHVGHARWKAEEDLAAQVATFKALELLPSSAFVQFNAGMIRWHLSKSAAATGEVEESGGTDTDTPRPQDDDEALPEEEWRVLLKGFLEAASKNRTVPTRAVKLAKAVLEGRFKGRPPLIALPEPPLQEEKPRDGQQGP